MFDALAHRLATELLKALVLAGSIGASIGVGTYALVSAATHAATADDARVSFAGIIDYQASANSYQLSTVIESGGKIKLRAKVRLPLILPEESELELDKLTGKDVTVSGYVVNVGETRYLLAVEISREGKAEKKGKKDGKDGGLYGDEEKKGKEKE